MITHMRGSVVPIGLSALLYSLLALAITWPLVLHAGTHVPNDLGDSLLNVFLLAWNARELPLTDRWWNLPQFHPVPGVMAFSEHLLGLSVLTSPVIALTGNALLGYNVAFLLSFPLCALAAHLLAFELARRHDVALVAGLAYGFAPYRMSQLAHVQVLSSYWMPLALLGLHLFLRHRQWPWLLLFAGAWYMQALACGYYLFYLSVLVGLWLLWFAVGRAPWRDLMRIAGAWTLAAAALAPFAMGYLEHQGLYGLGRGLEEIESFSADVASVLSAPGNLRVWGWLNVFGRAESALFPGLTVILVVAVGAILAWRAASAAERARLRAPRVLAALAVLVALVAATPVWLGPWRVEVAGRRLLSVGSAGKPLLIAMLLIGAAFVLHPAVRSAWRRRSSLAFYTLAAMVMWLLSLGPAPTLMGQPLLESAQQMAPYRWLMLFPGVDGVRVPARFWALATLCLSIAAALAAARVATRWKPVGAVLPGALAVLIAIEGWPASIRLWPAPSLRPSHSDAVARLEVPMGPVHDVVALYRASSHRLPVFNGYSGYFAPHYGALLNLVAEQHADLLPSLAADGPIEVLVDHAQDPARAWRGFLARQPGVHVTQLGADYTLYRVEQSGVNRKLPRPHAGRVAIARVEASVNEEDAGLLFDGDLQTRWHTGPQKPTNQLLLDLGQTRHVDIVELQVGGFQADFPRDLTIDLSADRANWETIWSGPTAIRALWAALDEPLTLPLRFPAHDRKARYIRLRQTAEDPVFYWSIAELAVYGS